MRILVVGELPIIHKTCRIGPKYFSRKGHKVLSVSPLPESKDESMITSYYKDTEFEFVPSTKLINENSLAVIFNRVGQLTFMILKIRKILRKGRCDVIRPVGFLPSVASVVARGKYSIPVVATSTDFYSDLYGQFGLPFSSFFSKILRKVESQIARKSDVFVTDTPIQRKYWGRLGVNEKDCVVLPHSFERNMSRIPEDSWEVREKYGISNETKVIFYCGDISKLDGLDVLIKAMPSVLRKVDAKLVIVGLGTQKYIELLQKMASDLNIAQSVIFVGQVSYEDMPKHIAVADVCVAPFRLTPTTNSVQSLKVLAYVMAKKPAVVTSGQGVQELFGDLLTYVPPEDVEALAVALVGALEQNYLPPEALKKTDILRKKFAWETIWDQEEKILDAAVNREVDDYRIFDFFK